MRSDVLVIGGGVVGLASAYHLKKLYPGLSVTLAEKAPRLCSGNSGRSAALYRNLFLSKVSRALAESSIAHYEGIGGDIALKGIGYLWTFGGPAWAQVRDKALALRSSALGVEVLEGDDLAEATAMDPGPASDGGDFQPAEGAILGRICGALSAQALASWYAERFVELGGAILVGVDIKRFELASGEGRGVSAGLPDRVTAAAAADGERYEADTFLLAAGCWLQDLLGPLGVASSVYPKKRQLFGFSAPEPAELYGRGRFGRPAIILPYGGIYVKPVLERGLAVAGRADDLGRAFELPYGEASSGPRAEEDYFRAHVEPALRAYFPRLAGRYPRGLELRQAWAGHYDYHWPDKNPVVERVANVVWVGGSSGSGIMKGDALGRIASAAVAGAETVRLADGRVFRPSDLSLRSRSVDAEGLVI